jgi:glycosyltransferase involved in cell wall biosynthesis
MNNKSILFICPDYHCSFFYRDELRKHGWKADIYVPDSYPIKLLYSQKDIITLPKIRLLPILNNFINMILQCLFYLFVVMKYKYHFYYGGIDQFHFFEKTFRLNKIFDDSFRVHLYLAKLFNRKVIQLPSGCLEEETQANFYKLDRGNVCNNCGWQHNVCNDKQNIARFNLVRKYTDMVVGTGSLESSQYKATHFKYKAIDLDLWHPNLAVPEEFRMPPTENLRILHSFYNENREYGGKNIKGSPSIVAAIERLKKEGFKVEYIFINNLPVKNIRYYQVQADIVVEQLIYGWWGSTLVETAALGKPVVCYLRPAWKEFFLKTFPEYDELPIVEATLSNIYDVLKKLVTDHKYRLMMGRKSRQFAEQHFDSKNNALFFADLLNKL